MGRTCGGFAEQRLRGGPSGLGGALLRPQGDPWKEREDEGCLLLGGHALLQGIFPTQGSNPSPWVSCIDEQVLYLLAPPGKPD